MAESSLNGYRMLLVEDEYMLADELKGALQQAGAIVFGPTPSVDGALDLIGLAGELDCALLDINLRGEKVFPVADALHALGIPFMFTTGYARSVVPDRYAHVKRWEKPINMSEIAATLRGKSFTRAV
jgi:CheY-like chemotaxis protein